MAQSIVIFAIHYYNLTNKVAVDIAYIPLLKFYEGELKIGAFHTGTINQML